MMEEQSVNVCKVVQRENDHAFVLHWGMHFPRPVQDRDTVTRCIVQKLEDGDCVVSLQSIEHDKTPHRAGVVRMYGKRLFRFSPVSPTVTRFTVTTVFNLGGSIPRFISDSFTTPAAARSPLSALRYFNQVKPAASFEAVDAKELGRLLVLDTDAVRGKKDTRPLEDKLRTLMIRTAVLRETRGRYEWFFGMMVEVLRNQVHRPSNTMTLLADYGEEEGRKVGGALALLQLKKVSPAAAVEAWIAGNPALGDLKQE
jgi:hypothetical protein